MIIDAKPYFSIRKAATIEQRYEKDLKKVSSQVGKIVSRSEPDDIDGMKDLVDTLKDYSSRIKSWSEKVVNKMFGDLDDQNKKEWQSLSNKMSIQMAKKLKDTDIEKAMQKYLDDNVKLITSLPLDAAKELHALIKENIHRGEFRAKGFAREIERIARITGSRASTIARTEVSRVATALVKARAEAVKIDWFVWRSTHDIRVRESHKLMDKVLVRWDDPPSPEELAHEKRSYGAYLPGAIFNCRCFAAPLVRVSDISWPAKVYHKGKITRMNREQFLNIKENEKYRKAA